MLQHHRRESGARHQARHRFACIRLQRAGAQHAKHGIQFLRRQIDDLKNAGLRNFHQKCRLVLELGGHRHCQYDFVEAGLLQRICAAVDIDFNLRCITVEENLRRIGNFQRQIFQVNLLDAELRLLLLTHCRNSSVRF